MQACIYKVICRVAVDGGERVRGYRQMSGHVGTLGGTPVMRGPPQVSRLLSCDPHTGTFLKPQNAKELILPKVDKDGVSEPELPKTIEVCYACF